LRAALLNGQQLVDADVVQDVDAAANPTDLDFIDPVRFSGAELEPLRFAVALRAGHTCTSRPDRSEMAGR
jgi:hypothetical protein